MMNPVVRHAGIAGVLTGLGLVLEFTFFTLGGYSPDHFGSAPTAVAFLQQHGDLFLRVAVLFGVAGAVVRTIYVAGLAGLLHTKTPTRAVATLYFGILGGIGHGLVALTFYVGLPMILALAAQDQAAAVHAWNALSIVTSGFQALGNLLLGLMLFVAGWAIISRKALWVGVGWVGMLASIATLLGVLTSETPLAVLGFFAYLPTFALVITFDIWVGILLWRSKSDLSTSATPGTVATLPPL